MKFGYVLLPIIALMSGCATSYDKAFKKAEATPFEQRPALYTNLLKEGDISAEDYKRWMKGWEEQKAEKEALAVMTPKEKAEYYLKKREVEAQERTADASEATAKAASAAVVQQGMSNANAGLHQNAANMYNTSH